MLLTNPQQIRAVRYAVGITIAMALATGIAWPLSFLFPVLSAVYLALPLPKFTIKQGIRSMRDTLFAFGVGYIYSQFILPFPIIYIPLLALALFYTYYHLNRGGSFWLVLMLLICLLLMPMLAGLNDGLAIGVVSGLVFSSWLTILLLWLSHYIVPDNPGAPAMPIPPGYKPGYSAPATVFALKSTIVVLPLALIFIANNWTSQILVLVFSAIFTLSPNLDKGKEAGLNSIKSTLVGGITAFFVYWALVAVPEYHFMILIIFITALGFGIAINSGKPMGKYFPSAMAALIVLLSSSLDAGANFSENFILRLIFITMASVYVVTALKVLGAFWPKIYVDANQEVVES